MGFKYSKGIYFSFIKTIIVCCLVYLPNLFIEPVLGSLVIIPVLILQFVTSVVLGFCINSHIKKLLISFISYALCFLKGVFYDK